MSDVETKDLTIAEGRIGEMLLAKYSPKEYHVIVPTHVVTIPEEIMELGVSVVHLSPNPRDGMVYPFPEAGNGMVALAKRGIEAIANAAGITDEPSRQVAFESGHFAIAEATVSCKLPTGEVIQRTRQKLIDVDARMREHEYNLRDRIEKGREKGFQAQGKNESDESYAERREKYIADKCMKRRLQLEKFLWELANTGAHLRAMKALLPSLKEIYHASELSRPFIVPRISIRPAVASNKFLAEAMRARARRDLTHLFAPVDEYEDVPPETAEKLRERDALMAELVEDFESGELMREALHDNDNMDGLTMMQEAYQITDVKVVEKPQPTTWPARPWEPETLWDYINKIKVPSGEGMGEIEFDPERLDFLYSGLSALLPDPKHQRVLLLYLFGEETIPDLSIAQYMALDSWMAMVPPDYKPSEHAIEETRRIIQRSADDEE